MNILQNKPVRLSYTSTMRYSLYNTSGWGGGLDRGLKAFRVKEVNNIVTLIPNCGNQTNKQTDKDEIYVIGKMERGSIVAFDIGGEEGSQA